MAASKVANRAARGCHWGDGGAGVFNVYLGGKNKNLVGGEAMSDKAGAYWKANLRLIISLLIIWFVVPFLGGIIFVDTLNEFRLGGYKLGFWVAQQGAIYLFVVLVFVYAWRANQLDARFRSEGS